MNRFLGIMGDTSVVGTILDLLDRYDPTVGGSGTLTPHEMKVLFGKLGFLLRGSVVIRWCRRASRALDLSCPMYSPCLLDDTWSFEWNETLTHSLVSFASCIRDSPCKPWRLETDETPWLLVYGCVQEPTVSRSRGGDL